MSASNGVFTGVKVPLASPVYQNTDGITLTDKGYTMINLYLDENNFLNKRPGLTLAKDLTSLGRIGNIHGMYWWPAKQYALVCSDGYTYKLTYSDGVVTVSALTVDRLDATQRVIFTDDGNRAYLVNGGNVYWTDGTTGTTKIVDDDTEGHVIVDAPTAATYIAFLDSYLLTNKKDSYRFGWSTGRTVMTNPPLWAASNFASASGSADNIVAEVVLNREVFLIGSQTTEIWENDGVTPFSRTPGGFIEVGCIAPYSVVKTADAVAWLDQDRNFVIYSGGKLSPIISPFDKHISSFEDVSDCTGSILKIGGKSFVIWQFISAGKTYLLDLSSSENALWSEWATWDDNKSNFKTWDMFTYLWCPSWGIRLVGSRNEPKIYFLSADAYSDEGSALKIIRQTGHIDHGTSKKKRSNEFRFKVKRGEGGDTIPQLMIRWKDDNKGWSNFHNLSLGSVGDTGIIVRIQRTGIYETRQWEVSCADNVPVIFGDAEEDFDILR